MATWTRRVERFFLSNGAACPSHLSAGKRCETFKTSRLTKSGQEPHCEPVGNNCEPAAFLLRNDCEPKKALVCKPASYRLQAATTIWRNNSLWRLPTIIS